MRELPPYRLVALLFPDCHIHGGLEVLKVGLDQKVHPRRLMTKISFSPILPLALRRGALTTLAFAASLAPVAAQAADADVWNTAHGPKFERISTFNVYSNLPEAKQQEETVAEIVAYAAFEQLLIHTDAEQKALGLVNIADPSNPTAAGTIQLDGEPTSVSVLESYEHGSLILVAVNTSQSYVQPSGYLAVIDLETRQELRRFDLAGQPDSVAIDPRNRFAAIVIENERDEDLEVNGEEGALPQLPAGLLQSIDLRGEVAAWNLNSIPLTGLADIAPEDPEPEFVDINRRGIAVVTLQENNHIVLVDLKKNQVIGDFSAGSVDLNGVDATKDKNIDPSETLTGLKREPDAVSWLDNYRLVTANEGDYEGGSRGFTIFDTKGNIRYDSGTAFENLAISIGHFPDKRAAKKGNEPEGVTTGRYGHDKLVFVGSERGNFVGVYKARRGGKRVDLLQVLPGTGVGPEGLLAIPERDLFVIANEKDDVKEGFRSTISIFRRGAYDENPEYPQIASTTDKAGKFIGWSALSGLTADRQNNDTLYAVADSALRPASIFRIDASQHPAMITERIVISEQVRREGAETEIPVKGLDLEGIAQNRDGGFWIASEGQKFSTKKEVRINQLLRVNDRGILLSRTELPQALAQSNEKYGFEGVAEYHVDGKKYVLVAIQRAWDKSPAPKHPLLARYDVSADTWGFYYYPLESTTEGWVGLSELAHIEGQRFAVIERDNQQGPKAAIKRVYEVDLSGLQAAALGGNIATVEKTLLRDLLPDLKARNGWTPDKVEGMAIRLDGRVTFTSDNDQLDDALGETAFWSIDSFDATNNTGSDPWGDHSWLPDFWSPHFWGFNFWGHGNGGNGGNQGGNGNGNGGNQGGSVWCTIFPWFWGC